MVYESVTTYEAAPAPFNGMSDGTVLYEQTTDTIYLYRDDTAWPNSGPIHYTNEYEIYRGPETR